MSRVNGINSNIFGGDVFTTKRNYNDNSELYIASKLDMLYKQAVARSSVFLGTRNLRQMVEGTYLDEQA